VRLKIEETPGRNAVKASGNEVATSRATTLKRVLGCAALPYAKRLGVVYLSGYTPFLKCYPGARVPQPVEITENWGSLSFQEAAKGLLRLTKLNWSTSVFSAGGPVTLTFPRQAVEIFRISGCEDIVLDDRYYL
jgi:hypothetical protein